MLAALGIILLVAGAIVSFAVDRSADGVDLMATGWILMAGGGLALLASMIQGAGSMSKPNTTIAAHHAVSTNGRRLVEELRRG